MKTEEDKMEKEKKSGNTSKIVGALVAGAAVGLAVGILMAPEKGKKTRSKLMEDAKDLTSKLKKKTNGFKEKASKHLAEKTDELKEKVNAVKEKVSNGIDVVTDKKSS